MDRTCSVKTFYCNPKNQVVCTGAWVMKKCNESKSVHLQCNIKQLIYNAKYTLRCFSPYTGAGSRPYTISDPTHWYVSDPTLGYVSDTAVLSHLTWKEQISVFGIEHAQCWAHKGQAGEAEVVRWGPHEPTPGQRPKWRYTGCGPGVMGMFPQWRMFCVSGYSIT